MWDLDLTRVNRGGVPLVQYATDSTYKYQTPTEGRGGVVLADIARRAPRALQLNGWHPGRPRTSL